MNRNPNDDYGRLLLNVKVGETVLIEDGFITIKVVSKDRHTAVLDFSAPKSVKIRREEKK